MRELWREMPLGDAADLIMGQSPPGESYNKSGDGLPFIQGSAEFGAHHPSPTKWCTEPRKVARPGDVLLSARAPVGDTNVADQEIAIGRGLAIVRGRGVTSTSAFLRLILEHGSERLLARSGGGMFSSITGAGLRSLEVSIPPLPEQRRIVDVVGELDDTIAAIQLAGDSLEEASERQRDVLPIGIEVPLGDILTSIQSGVSTKLIPGPGEPVNMLTLAAIRPARFYASAYKDVGVARLPERALLNDGDLLITRSNTPERVGYVCIARDVPPRTYLPDLVWRLCPDSSQVQSEYLEQALSSRTMRQVITAAATGTSQSMRKINKANFAGLRIPLPSLRDQAAYTEPLRAATEAMSAQANTLHHLHELRADLLTALLSGEHEIPESYDALIEGVA